MNISFIGSGNLAWHLAPALDNAGYVVKEVYSRNPKHAEALTERLYQAEVKATLDFSTSVSSVFFIATSDDAIENIAREIILPEEAYLFHVSGTQPLSELQYAATVNTGVFYPLQTFTRNKKIDFSTIPLFIESNNAETEKVMMELAKAISSRVKKIGSEERKALHVAAVFASNFSNHMLTLAKKVLEDNGLAFDLVKPLIVETLNKSLSMNPEEAQTGPARRGDLETLDKHIAFLKEEKELSAIYKIITQDILDTYQPE
ncbi:MAG: DUF2520 domain-containing protein [Azospira oryzae]|jgi:predicted short-subunit dehydrogenase-like oxidoreductase (DUF2520 family)|nr:MAG: DUF2520 domain-containing protein [Azospira oryzae]